MSEIRHRDRILEAIDQLRKRKARPDVNRICSFMFRRFAVNCIETKLDLQKLIDAEIVIKVDYKGNTSYRNAAKWAMLPSYKYKKEIDTSSIISSAVAELIVLEPDYLDIGVPGFELEAHMQQKDTKRFSKKNLEAILKREVEIGTLVKLENGNYFLGEHSSMNSNSTMDRPSASRVGSPAKQSPKANLASRQTSRQKKIKLLSPKHSDNSNDSDKMKVDDHSNSSESTNVGFRVGGRQKRARIVFDPSDNNLPTRVNKKRGPGRPLGSLNKSNTGPPNTPPSSTPPSVTSPRLTQSAPTHTMPKYSHGAHPGSQIKTFKAQDVGDVSGSIVCSICHTSGERVKGVPQRLISCSDCTNRAHRGCLENGVEGFDRDGLWRCLRCKSCAVCDETAEVGSLSICVICHDAYHHQCHSPPVPERFRTKQIPWHCSKCPDTNPPDLPVDEPAPPVREKPPPIRERPDPPPPPPPPTPPKREPTLVAPPPPPPPPEPKVRDVPANCLHDPFEDIPIDESIPDAKHWSTNQVYQYFLSHSKPEIAQVFKDQDVDGQSLLLMKRMDVLTSLGLKLGPALKVYGHVRKLQTRKSHPKILWS